MVDWHRFSRALEDGAAEERRLLQRSLWWRVLMLLIVATAGFGAVSIGVGLAFHTELVRFLAGLVLGVTLYFWLKWVWSILRQVALTKEA